MHGFDNGTATRVKRDNWGQLTRFFKKVRRAQFGYDMENLPVYWTVKYYYYSPFIAAWRRCQA